MKNVFTIAIDGPAGSGKGTLARALAKHYDFATLHTGLLYRALALASKGDIEKAKQAIASLDLTQLNEEKLHQGNISQLATKLASYKEVRDLLIAQQRQFAYNPPKGKKGAILEGRDIGTVILPSADVKIFITATLEARAQRRYGQVKTNKTLAEIIQEIKARDHQDTTRKTAPLKQAETAHLIDNTKLSIIETTNQAIQTINAARGQ